MKKEIKEIHIKKAGEKEYKMKNLDNRQGSKSQFFLCHDGVEVKSFGETGVKQITSTPPQWQLFNHDTFEELQASALELGTVLEKDENGSIVKVDKVTRLVLLTASLRTAMHTAAAPVRSVVRVSKGFMYSVKKMFSRVINWLFRKRTQ